MVSEENIIISNKRKFDKKKKEIQKEGGENLHVISDFDRTLTYGLTPEGKKTQTVISQLRSNIKYLGENYYKESHKLFDEYHPIEINPKISLEEKKRKMQEWWRKHFDLIIESGFTKSLIQKVIKEKPLKFRKGSINFLSFLNNKKIPFIIMSAGPGDMLIEYLKENKLLFPNIYVISNRYDFDSKGKAKEIRKPIIHTFNKTETSLKEIPIYNKIKNRKNILLLGDSLGDTGMAEGLPYKNIIKIGFLNENIKENLLSYKKNFDVVLTGDQNFDYLNKLIKELLR